MNTEPANLFDHHLLSGDCRWLYDVAATRLEDALAAATYTSAGKSKQYPFHINYSPGRHLDAAAWHIDPIGCNITIFSSTPVLILMACMQFAGSCDRLTAMPLSDNDQLVVQRKKIRLRTLLDHPVGSEADLTSILDPFFAARRANTALGFFLCEIALKFVSMHECMHVILGHTGYIGKHYGARNFPEFSRGKAETIQPLFSQMLEFIADRHTVRGLLVRMLHGDIDELHKENLLKDITIPEPLYLLRCLVHACAVLFHLFPGNRRSIFTRNKSHPHPYIRMRWICNELMTELDEREVAIDAYEPLQAMLWAAIHLGTNFRSDGNWMQALQQDSGVDGVVYSDEWYREIMSEAREWQQRLLIQYGPQY